MGVIVIIYIYIISYDSKLLDLLDCVEMAVVYNINLSNDSPERGNSMEVVNCKTASIQLQALAPAKNKIVIFPKSDGIGPYIFIAFLIRHCQHRK